MDLEPTTSSSTPILRGEKETFEPKLNGICSINMLLHDQNSAYNHKHRLAENTLRLLT